MRVSLFITCLSDAIYPRVGEAIVRLLAQQGIRVDFPRSQTCCGQPAFNSGYWKDAQQSAKTILKAFEDSDFVVSASGSCAGMILHNYEKLFENDPESLQKAKDLKNKTYEFTQFMVRVLGVTDLKATFPHKVTYHPSCHGSRLLEVQEEPILLMNQVKDMEIVPLPFAEDCCGFGGTFAVKMSEISGAMVSEKVDHIMETEAEVLVGLDMGCLMNISGHLHYRGNPLRVMHLAELLYEGTKKQGVEG